MNGSDPTKVFPSWNFLVSLEVFHSLLLPNLTLIPSHVLREAKKTS